MVAPAPTVGRTDRIALIPEAVVMTDVRGTIVSWNPAAESLYGYSSVEAVGAYLFELVFFDDDRALADTIHAALAGGAPWQDELRQRNRDGSELWAAASVRLFVDAATGEPAGIVGVFRDRTMRHWAELLEGDRSRVLELLLQERPQDEILTAIAEVAERHLDSIVCAILTVDEQGRFRSVVAPSLDDRYGEALRGAETTDRTTPCSLAAVTAAPVYVTDLEVDEDWRDCRPLAAVWGLRSCWSTPVVGPGNRALATFALYSRTPRRPTAAELSVIDALAKLVGLAVARDREMRALQDSERRRARVHTLMVRAEEAERARIASDLHDDTVQVLAATLISLDRLLSAPLTDDRRGVLEGARATLALATERTRHLMFDLRPQLLGAAGISAAIGELARRTALECEFAVKVEVAAGRYPEEVEALCYRTVSETLSNVREHARAASVSVQVVERAGELRGSVTDDGVGFDLDRRGPVNGRHMGIESMRERTLLAGGAFEIQSSVGAGTTVSFTLPLAG